MITNNNDSKKKSHSVLDNAQKVYLLNDVKNLAVVAIVLFIFVFNKFSTNIINAIIAYVIYLGFVLLFKMILYFIFSKEPLQIRRLFFLFFLFLPDYFSSKIYKPLDKEKRKHFIQSSNYLNIIVSVFLIAFYWHFNLQNRFYFYIPFLRVYSRSLEIIISFVKDVTSNFSAKKSNLSKYERIQLAINSYVDIVLMNTVLYYILGGSKALLNKLLQSIQISTFTYNSFTISHQNIIADTLHKQIVSSFQVITTISLVVLSLAIYASLNNKGG